MIEAYAAGADDFIAKPFHPQLLLTRIEAQLRLSTLERGLATLHSRAAALAVEVREPLDALAAARSGIAADAPESERVQLQEAVVTAGRRLETIVARLWS